MLGDNRNTVWCHSALLLLVHAIKTTTLLPRKHLPKPWWPSSLYQLHLLVRMVHIEQREVVAVNVRKPGLGLVCCLGRLARPREDLQLYDEM